MIDLHGLSLLPANNGSCEYNDNVGIHYSYEEITLLNRSIATAQNAHKPCINAGIVEYVIVPNYIIIFELSGTNPEEMTPS